jgi:glyoxylase-like metal-dependent hydrolase (beta-lactamase superfamily II)
VLHVSIGADVQVDVQIEVQIDAQARPFQLTPMERFHWLSAGYCTHREWVTIRGGVWHTIRFPAGFACIKHPQAGLILFDTGYSNRFAIETSHYPASIYRWLTPVTFEEKNSALQQLQQMGYTAKDVAIIVISHFHGDHIAGLRDFPNARFIYAEEAFEKVRRLRGLAAVRAGYLPGLLPDDFEKRSFPFQEAACLANGNHDRTPYVSVSLPEMSPFPSGYDILGDGSLLAVELPGHAEGQIGLFLSTKQQDYLLCADAAWSSRALRDNLLPHPLAGLIMPDRKAYRDSFAKLIKLQQQFPSVHIIPSHCTELH